MVWQGFWGLGAVVKTGGVVVALVVGVSGVAMAAEPPLAIPRKAPDIAPLHDWSGLYFGGHVGFGRGHTDATVLDPTFIPGTNNFGGLIGGLQLGYNYVLPSRLLFGVEADVTFANALDSNTLIAAIPSAGADVREQMDFVGTLRGRVGVVLDPWMLYATGGFAFAGTRIINDEATSSAAMTRPTVIRFAILCTPPRNSSACVSLTPNVSLPAAVRSTISRARCGRSSAS